MKRSVVRYDRVWTKENPKCLVNYVLLKQMNSIRIQYYFAKDNTDVIDHIFADIVVDGDDVLSGPEEEEDEEDQDHHDDDRKGR